MMSYVNYQELEIDSILNILTINSKTIDKIIMELVLEKYRQEAIKTIECAKYKDYDTNSTLKKYYEGDEPNCLKEIWDKISDSGSLTLKENREIFDYPIKYIGVSSNQGFINIHGEDIYFVESKQLSDIANVLITNSQTQEEYFGQGTGKLNTLIIEKFKELYPRKAFNSSGAEQDLFCSGEEYNSHIINHLKRQYILFINENPSGIFHKLIIPLFRLEKESKQYKTTEYIGGLLHILQHFQINKKPISAIDKTQKGDTEFYSDVLFQNIFECYFDILSRENTDTLLNSGTRNFCMELEGGLFLKGGFYYNHELDLWFLNTITQVEKC